MRRSAVRFRSPAPVLHPGTARVPTPAVRRERAAVSHGWTSPAHGQRLRRPRRGRRSLTARCSSTTRRPSAASSARARSSSGAIRAPAAPWVFARRRLGALRGVGRDVVDVGIVPTPTVQIAVARARRGRRHRPHRQPQSRRRGTRSSSRCRAASSSIAEASRAIARASARTGPSRSRTTALGRLSVGAGAIDAQVARALAHPGARRRAWPRAPIVVRRRLPSSGRGPSRRRRCCERSGATVTELDCEPDGRFPAARAAAREPRALSARSCASRAPTRLRPRSRRRPARARRRRRRAARRGVHARARPSRVVPRRGTGPGGDEPLDLAPGRAVAARRRAAVTARRWARRTSSPGCARAARVIGGEGTAA